MLFLWATAPLLPEALQVMNAWGLTYRQQPRMGQAKGWPGVLVPWPASSICWSGSAATSLRRSRGFVSRRCCPEPRREHFRKPDTVRRWLATWYSGYRLLEMFARTPKPGWSSSGNQAVDTSMAGLNADRFNPHEATQPR